MKLIGKHLNITAGKTSWKVKMPPTKICLHSKSFEHRGHSGWHPNKNHHPTQKMLLDKSKATKRTQGLPAHKLFPTQTNCLVQVYRLATILVLVGLYHGSIIRFASKAFRRSTGRRRGEGAVSVSVWGSEPREIGKFVLLSNFVCSLAFMFPLSFCKHLNFSFE